MHIFRTWIYADVKQYQRKSTSICVLTYRAQGSIHYLAAGIASHFDGQVLFAANKSKAGPRCAIATSDFAHRTGATQDIGQAYLFPQQRLGCLCRTKPLEGAARRLGDQIG